MSQKVLVAGTGISGIAAAKLLLAQGGEVVLYDGNDKLSADDLKKKFDNFCQIFITYIYYLIINHFYTKND